MTIIFLLGIGLYFILMTLTGYITNKRVKTIEDYLVAGRCLPFYLALPTILATWFSASSSLGVSGTAYSQGFYGALAAPFGCSLALLIGGLLFAAPFRRLKLLTVSDLLGKHYGKIFERFSTIIVLPFYIGMLASQMVAMGYVFQIVTGAPLEIGIISGALIVVLYTSSGGMWTVTLSDFIQFVLLSLGLVVILPLCLGEVEDQKVIFDTFLKELSTIIPQETSSFPGWMSYMGRLLVTGLGAIMGQDLLQRFLASRSESVARSSGIIGAFCYIILGAVPLFIGLTGRELYPNLENPEHLIPMMAQDYLSPVAFTLFACGLFSAIMSTADSYLLAGTTLITNNIILNIWPVSDDSKKLRLVRWVNILLAIIALLLAFSGQSIFSMTVHSATTLFVAIFVPASAALFWKRANALAAWISAISGMTAWLGCLAFGISQSELDENFLFSAAAFGALFSLGSYLLTTWCMQLIEAIKRVEIEEPFELLQNQ